jgi:exosome complex component RRP4
LEQYSGAKPQAEEGFVMDKKIVLPGEKIANGKMNVPNTFIEGDSTFAAVIGMLDSEGRYIPLENRYRPTVGDIVVGIITDVRHAGYEVDLNLPEGGFIPTRDMRINLQLGDFVICKVKMVNEVGDVDLGEVRRLPKGKIVEFPSAKVPRLIGRKSSMLMLLKDYAGGDIMVGNNGMVWISEKSDMPLVLKAIKVIEKKAHKSGLTEEISSMLKAERGERPASQTPSEEGYDRQNEGERYVGQ